MQILLLAAGMSTRMGGKNKLLLPYHGHTLFEESLAVALAATREVFVILGYQKELLLPLLGEATPIFNERFALGQEGSILAGLQAIDGKEDFAFAPADLPTLTREEYLEGFSHLTQHAIVRPAYQNTPGHPICYRREMREKAIAAMQHMPMREFVRTQDFGLYPGTRHTVEDIDTPTAYQDLISRT